MMFRLLLLGSLLPATLFAGVLTLTDGTAVEGRFAVSPEAGLILTPPDGATHAAAPGAFKSLTIDATDAIWPEALRALQTNEFGLLGHYFEGTELKGKPRVRIDTDLNFQWGSEGPFPDWRKDSFSARWSAHFQVPDTDDYEFITHSDDGVRLFINGQQLIANWFDHAATEDKTRLRLDAADLHELRVEYFENSGEAELRVEWAGRDHQRHPLNELILITTADNLTEAKSAEPAEIGLRPGVVLRDGTVLSAKIRRANDTAFELDGPIPGHTISTFNLARVVFREIPATLAAGTRPGRQGALLVGGDFVDSEFQSLENGILQLSSLLFGQQKLDTKYETHALLLRDPRPARPRWRVRDRSGSVLLAETLRFTPAGLTISNSILHELTLPIDTLVEITAGAPADLFPKSLEFGPGSVHGSAKRSGPESDPERRRIDSLKRMAEQEKSRRERELSDGERKARDERNDLAEARRKAEEFATKHTAAERDFDRLHNGFTEMDKTCRQLDEQRSQLEDAVQKLSREHTRLRAAISQIEGRQKREDSQAKNLERQRPKGNSKKDDTQLTAQQRELEKVRARQKSLLAELADAVRESETIRKQKETKDRELAAIKRDLGGRKSSLDRNKRSMDSAERQLKTLANQLAQYREKLTAAEAKVTARHRLQLR